MKVVVLTTSYPRNADDPAGTFVAIGVDAAREAGLEVEVVSPAGFRHFGIAYGHGIVGNLRARPWLVLLLPAFFWNFRRAAARAAREADLVHAHWLPAGVVAATLGRPFVVQVWGTDVELARRVPWLVRPVLRRARAVLAGSSHLADAAALLGARVVRIVPTAVTVPGQVAPPSDPPHVLFAGRLSPEKGIEDFLAATDGIDRVVVGAGPVAVAESIGAVAPSEVGRFYERAAVVCVPSRREGYGMVAREAMAYGRPLVLTAVGGLCDLAGPGVTSVAVGDVDGLRSAIRRLLGDAELRAREGGSARDRARLEFSRDTQRRALVDAYGLGVTPSPDGVERGCR